MGETETRTLSWREDLGLHIPVPELGSVLDLGLREAGSSRAREQQASSSGGRSNRKSARHCFVCCTKIETRRRQQLSGPQNQLHTRHGSYKALAKNRMPYLIDHQLGASTTEPELGVRCTQAMLAVLVPFRISGGGAVPGA